MNGPADRSVRLLLLLSGFLIANDSARMLADRGAMPEPLPELKIRINTASADHLRLLPGIGPVVADRVIAQRSIRPFRHARVIVTEGRDGNAGSGSDGTARVERGRPLAGSPIWRFLMLRRSSPT